MSTADRASQQKKEALKQRRPRVERQAGPVAPDNAIEIELFGPGAREVLRGQPANLSHLDTATRQRIFRSMQRRQGNACVGRMVEMSHSEQVPLAGVMLVQRSPGTQAQQEAEAATTIAFLNTVHTQMLTHANPTVRNTARLFTSQGGQPARMHYDAMTPRSDSSAAVTALGLNPADTTMFFYGPTQNNSHQHSRTAIGTIDMAASKILVRRLTASGAEQSADSIMGTFAHETSHVLVASYGEHPNTTSDAASFDRYKDEFRAYWIEPVGHWAAMEPNDDKATAIRNQMVGTSQTSTTGYPSLRNHYWTDPAFKAQVDNHKRPDGFNLTNNPNLDRLFQLLTGLSGGTSTIETVLNHIVTTMSQAERTQAKDSPLIQRRYQALDEENKNRVMNAIRFPFTHEYARQIDPAGSPRIAAFLEAIISRNDDTIKEGFRQLNSTDFSRVRANSGAVTLFIDIQSPTSIQRAATYAMVMTGQIGQFDAMRNFLGACFDAALEAAVGAVTEVPATLRTTLQALAYPARLALYRLLEDVRRTFVDTLPAPINRRILNALLEGGEPE